MKINITKRFLLSLCLMTLTLLCGGNKAWGQAATSTLTFIKACGGSGTADDGVVWTVTSDAAESNYDDQYGRGIHYGTSKKAVSYLQLSTSGITGVVKKIVVNASGASATSAKLVVTVDGNSFGDQKTITSTAKDYTFEGTGSGEIIVKLSQTSAKKALYVKSISVTYQKASTPTPAPTFSLPGGTYYGERSVSISVDGTGSILYTTNGTDPKTNGTEYTKPISLPVGTKLTLKAVAKYGEELFSEVTEATYDIQKASSTFFQRITSAAELTANETYLIVCESKNVAFGKINSSDKGTPQAVTITGNKIDLSAAGTGTPIEFTLEGNESSGYLLKNPTTGNYIVLVDDTDVTETKPGTALNISFETNGSAKIYKSGTTRQILYRISTTSFGNYASSNLTNAQNKADYGTVYLYKKHVISDFTFSDTEDLKASLPKTSPLADQTVTLNRNLYSGWNTFCVPFALTQAQLEEAYGSGAVAKYLSDVTTDGAAATLHFTPENGGGIEANKAYLLYLTADVTEAKTFSGVTLQPAGTCTTTVNTDNGDYTFQGILTPTALETNDRQYFLNSAGTYFVLPLNNTSQMKATRAYIIVPTPTGSAQGRQYNFDFNGTTTAIDKVTVSGMEDGAWYTISGIRINRPAAKGVYIHNGRKVIVK